MTKTICAMIVVFPMLAEQVRGLMLALGVTSPVLVYAIALWMAIGALADVRRAFLAMGPKARGAR